MPDKITPLFPRLATVTGSVPSENPDAPHLRSDNLRLPADLAPMGLDASAWPFSEGSTRVERRTLPELRDRAESLGMAAAETEQAMLNAASLLERAARMNALVRAEVDTLAKRLAELADDDETQPPGAA